MESQQGVRARMPAYGIGNEARVYQKPLFSEQSDEGARDRKEKATKEKACPKAV